MYFLSFGDWGEHTPLRQLIILLICQKRPHAILSLGDNFYNYGVESIHDPLWTTYSSYYPPLPFYAILGNHDYLGNSLAQIQYSKTHATWIMPHRYYDRMYSDVHLIALDTFELAPNESLQNSICMGMNPTTFRDKINVLKKDPQIKWLEHVLSVSTSRWKIVFGHYPVFSNGPHGDTPELIELLIPLFKKYKVHLYLAGHDHTLCHREQDGVHYVVSGTGARVSNVTRREEFTQLKDTVGTAYVRTSMEQLEFGFYDTGGGTIFNKIISTS